MTRPRWLTAALLVAATASANVRADMITATADAYVHSGSNANNNFGSAATMLVKRDNTDGSSSHRKAYIRFDLASLSFDHTTDLGNAVLRLGFVDSILGNGGSPTWGFSVYGLNDGDAGESWVESGTGSITWNNAPANNTANGYGLLSNATFLASFSFAGRVPTDPVVQISSAALTNFIANSAANDLVTFIIVRDTPAPNTTTETYVHALASRTNGSDSLLPRLELTTVPEPAALGLLAAALAAVALFLRRRSSK